MSDLRALLGRLKVTVKSPDGSVRVALTTSAAAFALRPGIGERHTERSLEGQVEAALASALGGYAEAAARVRGLAAGRTEPIRVDDTEPGDPRRRIVAGLDAVEGTGYSEGDYVGITWRGSAGFGVSIRPGALRELGEDGLAAELDSAFRAAASARRPQLRDLVRSVRNGGENDGRR